MSSTEVRDDLPQEGEHSCKKINDLCKKSGELEKSLELGTAVVAVNPMTAFTVPQDGVRAFLADAPDAFDVPDASATVAKKARKDSPPPLEHIRISWFLIGKIGKKEVVIPSHIAPPVSTLNINPYTKKQFLETYGSMRIVFKMPEILQFPGAYAVWTDEPLEGIEPLDPVEFQESNARIARAFTPSDFKYLYGMSSDSILA